MSAEHHEEAVEYMPLELCRRFHENLNSDISELKGDVKEVKTAVAAIVKIQTEDHQVVSAVKWVGGVVVLTLITMVVTSLWGAYVKRLESKSIATYHEQSLKLQDTSVQKLGIISDKLDASKVRDSNVDEEHRQEQSRLQNPVQSYQDSNSRTNR